MSKYRIATFNCNNLFARPRIFAKTKAATQRRFDNLTELRDELNRDVYDQAKIKALKKKLSGFITIVDARGKKHYNAAGRDEWTGWIHFKRETPNNVAIQNTARVIKDTNADIICLVEVEDRIQVKEFLDDLLVPLGGKYKHVMLIDGNDDRGIDVAIMSKKPIGWVCSHADETCTYMGKTISRFSRDCIEIQTELPNGKILHLMGNHLKSMGYSHPNDPGSDKRRRGQAVRVAELAQAHNLNSEYVAIAGDFNSPPESSSLEPILEIDELYNVNEWLPEDERGTYKTGTKAHNQLDYIVVSKPLKSKLEKVEILRKGHYSSKWDNYPTVDSKINSASDHCAVVAEFKF